MPIPNYDSWKLDDPYMDYDEDMVACYKCGEGFDKYDIDDEGLCEICRCWRDSELQYE